MRMVWAIFGFWVCLLFGSTARAEDIDGYVFIGGTPPAFAVEKWFQGVNGNTVYTVASSNPPVLTAEILDAHVNLFGETESLAPSQTERKTLLLHTVSNATGDVTITVTDTTPGLPDQTHALHIRVTKPFCDLVNLSTRAFVQGKSKGGEKIMIGGFVVEGDKSKTLLVRALGPSLNSFGVNNPLSDPRLEIRNAAGKLVANNDNWQDSQAAEIQASGLAPTDAHEAAVFGVLEPGAYTALLRAPDGQSGIALLEAYDLDVASGARPVNISTRAYVGSGDNVMIGGFVVDGLSKIKVAVRALGPSLAAFGVQNVLQDPVIELHNGTGAVVATNDNWGSDRASGIQASGYAPRDARESVLITELAPGNYTAVTRGAGGSTGVGLMEVYALSGEIPASELTANGRQDPGFYNTDWSMPAELSRFTLTGGGNFQGGFVLGNLVTVTGGTLDLFSGGSYTGGALFSGGFYTGGALVSSSGVSVVVGTFNLSSGGSGTVSTTSTYTVGALINSAISGGGFTISGVTGLANRPISLVEGSTIESTLSNINYSQIQATGGIYVVTLADGSTTRLNGPLFFDASGNLVLQNAVVSGATEPVVSADSVPTIMLAEPVTVQISDP